MARTPVDFSALSSDQQQQLRALRDYAASRQPTALTETPRSVGDANRNRARRGGQQSGAQRFREGAQGSRFAGAEGDVLPRPQLPPPPANITYAPLYDPRRGLFPNIQATLQRQAEPNRERRAGQVRQANVGQALSDVIGGVGQGLGNVLGMGRDRADRYAGLNRAAERIGGGIRTIGSTPAGVTARNVASTALALAPLPSDLTEQAIGTAAQTLGISPQVQQNLRRAASAGQQGGPVAAAAGFLGDEAGAALRPVIRRTVANILQSAAGDADGDAADILRRFSQQLRDTTDEASTSEETIAAAIAWTEMAGNKPAQAALDRAFRVMEPDEQRRRELLDTARVFVSSRGFTDMLHTWDSSRYTYENADRIAEARERLANGEAPESVFADIDASLVFRERMRDMAYKFALDPLNIPIADQLSDMMKASGSEWAVAVDAAEALRPVLEAGDIANPSALERIPVLGKFFGRTAATRAKRISEEAAQSLSHLFGSIDEDAALNLAEAGVRSEHPLALALRAFIDPDATDILGTGKSSDEIMDLVGLGKRAATEADAKRYGVAVGSELDFLRTAKAHRARHVMRQFVDRANVDNWVGRFDEIAKEYQDLSVMSRGAARSAERKAFNAAADAANDKLADWMNRFEEVSREIAGFQKEPTGLAKAVGIAKKPFDTVQGFFAEWFHMNTVPGWMVRNSIQNWTQTFSDGIINLNGWQTIDNYVDENGLRYVFGNIREFGGRVDGLGKPRLIGKLNQMVEQRGRVRIFTHTVERTFKRHWRLGDGIDAAAYDEMAAVVGEGRARQVLGQMMQARTKQQARQIVRRLNSDDAWRVLDDVMVERLERLEPGTGQQIQRILDDAPDLQTALNRIASEGQQFYDDMLEQAIASYAPTQGTAEGHLVTELSAYLNDLQGMSEADRIATMDQFTRQVATQNFAVQRAENAVLHMLDDLPDVNTSTFERALGDVRRAAEQRYNEAWVRLNGAREALRNKDLAALANIDGFSGVADESTGWLTYFHLRDMIWRTEKMATFDEYIRIGNEVMAQFPDAARSLPAWDDIVRNLPLANDQQTLYYMQLMRMARKKGMNPYHLTNWLKKNTTLLDDADVRWLQPHHVQSDAWIDEAQQAILRLPDKPLTADPGAWLDDVTEAALREPHLLHEVGNPAQQGQRIIAQQLEFQSAMDELGEYLLRGQTVPRQLDEADAVARFVDAHTSRLNEMRRVASQMGVNMADFTLFNYSDRRNFDTAMGFMFSYPFWYTRNMAHWVQNAYYRPGALAAWLKLENALRAGNQDLPEWWQDQLTLDTAAGQLYFPILNAFSPLHALIGDKFRDPYRRSTPVGTLLDEMQQFGPGIHSLWSMVMSGVEMARGNRDGALSWMNFLGQPSRAFNSLTVLAREAGADFIPAGGAGIEPWMWEQGIGRVSGTPWENRRLALTLIDMVNNPDFTVNGQAVTMEQAVDALAGQNEELYSMALQELRRKEALWNIWSWVAGPGFKGRPESALQVAQMDALAHDIMRRKPGSGAPDELSPEAYRQAWRAVREDHPYIDLVYMSRRSPEERDEMLAWNVLGRLPPNSREILKEVGLDPRLIDKWYDKQFSGMSTHSREEFVAKIHQLSAILALPPQSTRDSWDAARDSYRAMRTVMQRDYGENIWDLYDSYFGELDGGDPDAFLEAHPELSLMLTAKDKYVRNDPLLAPYYASMDMLERISRAEFNDAMRRKYPGLDPDAFWDEYFTLKATDPDAANALFDEHPQMNAYLAEQELWTLRLRDELEQMGGTIEGLESYIASLRGDAAITTPGQQDVSDLIAAQGATAFDFELPEDLSLKELQSELQLEVSAIREAGAWRQVTNALRDMGNLDRTFTAYQQWGDRGGDISTVGINEQELRSLLVALETVRQDLGYAAITPDNVAQLATGGLQQQAVLGGGGQSSAGRTSSRRSYGGGRRYRSKRGGKSRQPQTPQQASQLQEQIRTWVAQLRGQDQNYWNYLRNLADMTPDEQQAFLTQYPDFARVVLQAYTQWGLSLQDLLGWFNQAASAPVSSGNTGRSSGGRPGYFQQTNTAA